MTNCIYFPVTCLTSSVLTLSAISCDRYMAIMYPLRSRVTKKRTDAVIAVIWLCSLAISTPFFLFRRLQTLHVCLSHFSVSNATPQYVFIELYSGTTTRKPTVWKLGPRPRYLSRSTVVV